MKLGVEYTKLSSDDDIETILGKLEVSIYGALISLRDSGIGIDQILTIHGLTKAISATLLNILITNIRNDNHEMSKCLDTQLDRQIKDFRELIITFKESKQ